MTRRVGLPLLGLGLLAGGLAAGPLAPPNPPETISIRVSEGHRLVYQSLR
ncbi:MAG: hypothetical protein ACRENB_14315 [Gemmatimonadales bacterium]